MPADLPDTELATYLDTIDTAVLLARHGEVMKGFSCLCEGLECARDAAADGEPWGPALVRQYEEARDRYVERYGGRLVS